MMLSRNPSNPFLACTLLCMSGLAFSMTAGCDSAEPEQSVTNTVTTNGEQIASEVEQAQPAPPSVATMRLYAQSFLSECLDLTSRIADETIRNGLYHRIATEQAALGDSGSAIRTVGMISDTTMANQVRFNVAKVVAAHGDLDAVAQLTANPPFGYQPSLTMAPHVYAVIAHGDRVAAIEAMNNLHEAKGLLSLSHRADRVVVLTGLTKTHSKSGDCVSTRLAAEELWAELSLAPRSQERDVRLVPLAHYQLKCEDANGALRTAQAMSTPQARDGVLEQVVTLHASLAEFDKAQSTASDMTTPRHRAEAYSSLGLEQARNAAKASAKASFQSAVAAAAEIREGSQRSSSLQKVAKVQSEAGMQDEALDTLAQARAAIKSLPNPDEIALLNLARTHAAIGDKSGAADIAAELLKAASESTQDAFWKSNAMRNIAPLQPDDQARQTLREAESLAQTIDDTCGRSEVVMSIAMSYRQIGAKDEAQRLIAEAKRLVGEADNAHDRMRAARNIATEQLAAYDIEEALETVQILEDPQEQANTLAGLITNLRFMILHEEVGSSNPLDY